MSEYEYIVKLEQEAGNLALVEIDNERLVARNAYLEARATPSPDVRRTLLAALEVYRQECGNTEAVKAARAWVAEQGKEK